ncbi:hypothetical protein BDQ12DRAFT_715485 [Crucibulum laeve]|uniref:Uncharacterized protein n=1 Tax=Crucibulum laeve TaxID=68775 RepID=A0A5C3LMW5_9AGAR|nr:hypothetical protein BDQ12DRAFT_715485 [Crucibulum laeve]
MQGRRHISVDEDLKDLLQPFHTTDISPGDTDVYAHASAHTSWQDLTKSLEDERSSIIIQAKSLTEQLAKTAVQLQHTQKEMNLCTSLLSSPSRLPLEILSEIFLSVQKSGDDYRYSHLILQQVCSMWKLAAQSTPQLWIHHLELHVNGPNPATKLFPFLGSDFVNLESIMIELDSSSKEPDTAVLSLRHAIHLRRLDLSSSRAHPPADIAWSSLTSLSLAGGDQAAEVKIDAWREIFQQCFHLKHGVFGVIGIENWSPSADLQTTVFNHLETLKFYLRGDIDSTLFTGFQLPRLIDLEISVDRDESWFIWIPEYPNFDSLERLTLERVTISPSEFVQLSDNMASLLHLKVDFRPRSERQARILQALTWSTDRPSSLPGILPLLQTMELWYMGRHNEWETYADMFRSRWRPEVTIPSRFKVHLSIPVDPDPSVDKLVDACCRASATGVTVSTDEDFRLDRYYLAS